MIRHYCRIVNYKIFLDGTELYRHDSAVNVTQFLESAYQALGMNYPKFYKMDNLSKAGVLAAEMLFRDLELKNQFSDENISVVMSNASGSLDTDSKYQASTRETPSPSLFVYTLANIVVGEICIRHKLKGENAFFVSEVFDAELFNSYVQMLPKHQLCLAGWAEVMGDDHDVFLYLLDHSNTGLPHTASSLKKLYSKDYGTVNG